MMREAPTTKKRVAYVRTQENAQHPERIKKVVVAAVGWFCQK
jgi:hypothetical protein